MGVWLAASGAAVGLWLAATGRSTADTAPGKGWVNLPFFDLAVLVKGNLTFEAADLAAETVDCMHLRNLPELGIEWGMAAE